VGDRKTRLKSKFKRNRRKFGITLPEEGCEEKKGKKKSPQLLPPSDEENAKESESSIKLALKELRGLHGEKRGEKRNAGKRNVDTKDSKYHSVPRSFLQKRAKNGQETQN